MISILLKISVPNLIDWVLFPLSFIVFILLLRKVYKEAQKKKLDDHH